MTQWSTPRLYLRYLRYLLWEFRGPLVVFGTLVLVGGLVLYRWYDDQPLSFAEACYGVFLLTFLEPYLPFPKEWYLQPLFFLLPIIGLGAVVDSVVRLGYLVFARKNRLPEWQRMMASIQRNHTIVVGLGKVGYRIVRGLLDLREPVVVIDEAATDGSLLDEIQSEGVPIIRGDGRSTKILEEAGIRHARAVILATSDDLANLDAGLSARDLNPEARIVLRLFDESLAAKVQGAFALPAISTARVAAPAFIAAATGRRVYQEFELAGQRVYLVDLTVRPGGGLVGLAIGQVQSDPTINVVMHRSSKGVNVNPRHDERIQADDELLIIAPMDRLREIELRNRMESVAAPSSDH